MTVIFVGRTRYPLHLGSLPRPVKDFFRHRAAASPDELKKFGFVSLGIGSDDMEPRSNYRASVFFSDVERVIIKQS